MHSKIAQSGTMELQDVTGLQFDDLAARFSPYNWEEFFARIPIEEQKETKFAYDAQQTIDGYLPKGKGLTIQKMLDNHPFGHLIAENMKRVVGLTPVHVVHHIAYDNGDEASLIHKLLHVDVQDEEDEEGDINKGPFHTHRLFALQGLGRTACVIELFLGSADSNCFSVPRWKELLLFTIDNFEDGTFQYSSTEADRLCVTNGIIAIPAFMTVALTRAHSTDSKVLCMAAVGAIRHVLEEEDEIVQQDMVMHLKYIPQWLFLVSKVSPTSNTFGIEVDWLDRGDNTSWLHDDDFNRRFRRADKYAFELEDTTLHRPDLEFL